MNPMPKAKILEEILEAVIENGTESILPVMQTLLNFAMQEERSQFLQAEPYERSSERKGVNDKDNSPGCGKDISHPLGKQNSHVFGK